MKFTRVASLVVSLVLFTAFGFAQTASTVSFGRISIPNATVGGQFTVKVFLCQTSSTDANCAANTGSAQVATFYDNQGASAITQPLFLDGNGQATFYSAPGTYRAYVQLTSPSSVSKNYDWFFDVSPDYAGAVAEKDGTYFVPASLCYVNLATGAAGTSNNTIVWDGASVGTVSTPALEAHTTAATAHPQFVCNINPPSRLTAGKGITIQDVTLLYSQQGSATTLTQITPTVVTTAATIPVPCNTNATCETASTAVPVAAGGTITPTPSNANANLTAVSAGQYYSLKAALGTPFVVDSTANANGLTELLSTFEFDQSGSIAVLITSPGAIVHYSINTI